MRQRALFCKCEIGAAGAWLYESYVSQGERLKQIRRGPCVAPAAPCGTFQTVYHNMTHAARL
jgi:hypothetical protein